MQVGAELDARLGTRPGLQAGSSVAPWLEEAIVKLGAENRGCAALQGQLSAVTAAQDLPGQSRTPQPKPFLGK